MLPNHLLQDISENPYECGMISSVEEYCKNLSAEQIEKIFESLNKTAMETNNFTLKSNILIVLSQLECKQISEKTFEIVENALSADDFELNELGIRCLENWEDPQLILEILPKYHYNGWLEEYRQIVYDMTYREQI